MLKIENLTESRELDVAAASELHGGYGVTNNMLTSYSLTSFNFSQNAVNIGLGTGAGGLINIGSLTASPISAASPMTFVYAPGGAAI